MYVDPEIMIEEDYFPSTIFLVANYKKISTPVPGPKHWLGFSYIRSKDCESDLKFDKTELKRKSDHTSKDKVKLF